MAAKQKLIILDRDGVINQDSDAYIKSPDEWIAIPNSLEAIAQLNRLGYLVTVATNQSGVGRGYYDLETLDRIHQKMHCELKVLGGYIDYVAFCLHRPDEDCHCRKPKPGLIETILQKYPVPADEVWMVGDSLRDLQAGQAVGCQTALVRTGKGLATLMKNPDLQSPVFDNLANFVAHLS